MAKHASTATATVTVLLLLGLYAGNSFSDLFFSDDVAAASGVVLRVQPEAAADSRRPLPRVGSVVNVKPECQPGCAAEAAGRFPEAMQWFTDHVHTCGFNLTAAPFSAGGFEGSVRMMTTPCGTPIAVKSRHHEVSYRWSRLVRECELMADLVPVAKACNRCIPEFLGVPDLTHNGTKQATPVCVMSRDPHALPGTVAFDPKHSPLLLSISDEQLMTTIRDLLVQAFTVVALLDSQQVLHADFKPANVLITNNSASGVDLRYKMTLIDFGAAVNHGVHYRAHWAQCQALREQALAQWQPGSDAYEKHGPHRERNWRGPCKENAWGMARMLVRLIFTHGARFYMPPKVVVHKYSVLWVLAQVESPDFRSRLRDVPTIVKLLRNASEWA